jgi:alpha-L-rhamnosidase
MAMMRLKLRTDTPQLYEDIHFRDIVLEGRGTLVSIAPWTQYFDLKGHAPPARTIRNVSVSNITGSFGGFGSIAPGSGDTIEQLTFENIDLTVASATARITGVKDLVIKNVKLNGKEFTAPGE